MSTALGVGTSASASKSTPYTHLLPQNVVESPISSSIQPLDIGSSPSNTANLKSRTQEEKDIAKATAARFASKLAADQHAVLHPDVETPFTDYKDALARLLPYHVFQQPKDDLTAIKKQWKGKAKATEDDLQEEEIAETKFALECYSRRKALEKKWNAIKVRSAKRTAPSDQALVLAQAILEADRLDINSLNGELRQARIELDKIERAKRQEQPRPTYQPAAPMQYYQGYAYAYPHTYTSSFRAAPSYTTPTTATIPTYAPAPATTAAITSAIPVQLPVALLPSLNALGIRPVPPPLPGQPPAAAVLRGSNGTMANLLFEVSLLQPNQMTGLAMILNSLMATGINAHSSTPQGSSVAMPVSTPSSTMQNGNVTAPVAPTAANGGQVNGS